MDIEERQQLRKKVLDFLEAHGIAYTPYADRFKPTFSRFDSRTKKSGGRVVATA